MIKITGQQKICLESVSVGRISIWVAIFKQKSIIELLYKNYKQTCGENQTQCHFQGNKNNVNKINSQSQAMLIEPDAFMDENVNDKDDDNDIEEMEEDINMKTDKTNVNVNPNSEAKKPNTNTKQADITIT